jgi:hypothetical protein
MKRSKTTDFILKYCKWTGMFLYNIIYWKRLNLVLSILSNIDKDDETKFITTCILNDDVITGYTIDMVDDKKIYNIKVC